MKKVPDGNKGLSKLPKNVRNKMGYMKQGGMVKPKLKMNKDTGEHTCQIHIKFVQIF